MSPFNRTCRSLGCRLFAALRDDGAEPVARSCRRREQAVGWGLALLAFTVYVWSLCPGVFPGASALACAEVLRVLPDGMVSGHPLWGCAARLAALLPLGEAPFRLNLFSALCGAGAVALVFRLTTMLLYEALRDEVWVVQMESDPDDPSAKRLQGLVEEQGGRTARANHQRALAGGIVSALAFAFCTPFWSASVSLHAQTFDLLLLLATGYMLACYAFSGLPFYFAATAFLCGLGVLESVAFVVLLPAVLTLLLCIGKRRNQLSESFILLLLFCLAAGLLLTAGIFALRLTHGGAGLSATTLVRVGVALARDHAESLQAGLPRLGWLLILFQCVVPVLAIFWCVRTFFFTRDILTRWSWGAINALITAVIAGALLNLPGSCWQMTRDGAGLPIMPLLSLSMACGGLLVYGMLLCSANARDEVDDDAPPDSPLPRMLGSVLIAVVSLLVIVAPFRNAKDADGRRGAFADAFCRELLASAPQARCLVTDGAFDVNLLVSAHLSQRHIVLLRDRAAAPPRPTSRNDRLPVEPAPDTLDFVDGWLRRNADRTSQVAFLSSPDRWTQAGFVSVPNLLVYSCQPARGPADTVGLLERHRVFWQRIEPLLAAAPPRIGALYRMHIAMRMHASRVANDLGVLCLRNAAPLAADEAFRHAQGIDTNNLCAFLNQYALHLEHPEIGSSAQLQRRLDAFANRKPMFDSVHDYETCYGSLHRPAIEHLVTHCAGRTLSRTSEVPESSLMSQLAAYCRTAILSEAVPAPLPSSTARGAVDAELAAAVGAITNGQWHAAETRLRIMLQKRRTVLAAWSLLAEVLMNRGRFDEVADEVLPAMRLVTTARDLELIDMTEGALALRRQQPDYGRAHACFRRVLQRNPDIVEAQNQLLQSSLALADQRRVEEDGTNLLARTPAQPMASALLGGLRLSQGRLPEAEAYLRASITSLPSAPAFNDLAETLRRTRQPEAAEAAARRALLLDRGFYQAWDTLALVLADAGKLDDASTAHQAALGLCKTDIRLYLSAAELEKRRNRPDDVRRLLAATAPLLKQASSLCRAQYDTILVSP